MNENEIETPLEQSAEKPGEALEDAVAAVDQTVETASQSAAEAATEAEAPIETLSSAPIEGGPAVAETRIAGDPAPIEPPKALPAPEGTTAGNGGRKPTITDRLAEDTEFDPSATNDDRVMAALAYASQLVNPIGLVLPIIILVSETSKQRPFQRYHAVQSLAVSAVIGLLQLGLTVLASAAGATVIGILCLCFIVPAMIMLWLLPLYYALIAYNGKRFRIPGLTQFLQDQRWL